MKYGEVTKSKQSLLMLTSAVIQLIQTSTTFEPDPLLRRESSLFAYHRTKQTELLNQLYEVILLRINALSANENASPSASETEETEIMESFVKKLLAGLLSLSDSKALPKEEYILSIERLQEKLISISQNKKTDPSVNEDKETIKSAISPILHWSKNESKKTGKQKNKRDHDTFQIQIGSTTYRGSL